MIQSRHWRQATRAALKQAAADQDRSIAAVLRLAGIDRSALEPRYDDRGLSMETLAKLDAVGVFWRRIALEAERLAQNDRASTAPSAPCSAVGSLPAAAQ